MLGKCSSSIVCHSWQLIQTHPLLRKSDQGYATFQRLCARAALSYWALLAAIIWCSCYTGQIESSV